MNLREARCAYSVCIAELVLYAVSQGYDIALDEGADHITAKDPTSDHMKGSVHEVGLGQDVLLYRNGVYLTQSHEYAALGLFWKELGVKRGLPLRWGGDFKKPDGNHFSLEWLGVQ